MKRLVLIITLLATQYTTETIHVKQPDGTVKQIVVEKIEPGRLVIDQKTGETVFIPKEEKSWN